MYKYILFFFIFLFSGCNDFLDAWEGYEIKKGEHYSHRTGIPRRLVSLYEGRHLLFQATFTNSCLYTPENDDINKLYGFTDVNSLVHDNSVRFGWRHDGSGIIEIFAYWYIDGIRGWEKLGETSPYIKDDYEIWARNGWYYFRFNTNEFSIQRSKDAEHGIRNRLFPYFGGDKTAPNDILIFIHEYS